MIQFGFLTFFSLFFLGSMIFCLFTKDIRRSALALCGCGLSLGSLFIFYQVEFLGFLLWVLTGVVGFAIYAFGELFERYDDRNFRARWFSAVVPILFGAVMLIQFWALFFKNGDRQPLVPSDNLKEIGLILVSDGFVPIILIALIALVGIVGAGMVSKFEVKQK